MVQHLIVGDLLAGVRCESTHGGDHAGLYAALTFVERFVVANGGHQVVPFVLIRIALAAGISPSDRIAEALSLEDFARGWGVACL